MSLTFIYGNSGSGKTEYIIQQIVKEAKQNPYKRFYMIVPEQFTMHTQKSLVDHTENGVIMNIDVVSFARLAYRIFDELGVHHTVIEETGKSLILRRLVEENEDKLTVLKRNMKKMGYISQLKSIISEFMQYGISPADVEQFVQSMDGHTSLSMKLKDILTIYQSFDAYLENGYVTSETVLDLLIDQIDRSELLKDAVLVFDGYTGFTPVQMNLIRRLMKCVQDIYVTVTLDTREPLYTNPQIENLFYMSQEMVHKLVKVAQEEHFDIAQEICIHTSDTSRLAGKEMLLHLEQNLFRIPYQIYQQKENGEIQAYSLGTPKAELQFAAAKIAELVREKGYRYQDFAIVSGNVEEYANYADAIFEQYEIPYFSDVKQSVLYHPLVELVRSILDVIESEYSCDSVFRFLRTGLTGIETGRIDDLENYCIAMGIQGSGKWSQNFLKVPKHHGRISYTEEEKQSRLKSLNETRETVWALTSKIYQAFKVKEATIGSRTKALYQFVVDLQLEERLQAEQLRFEARGEARLAGEYRQIYKFFIDLLDKLVSLLGEESISTHDYTQILEAGFSDAKIGSIPPDVDCVIIGDIERTRLDGIKILFFLGVNDGLIPKNVAKENILSQYDREYMEQQELTLSPTAREQVFLQRLYLYLNLTKPSDALYITYSRMGSDGKSIRPSYLINTMRNLFGQLEIVSLEGNEEFPFVTPKSSLDYYLSGLSDARKGKVGARWKALHKWFHSTRDWAPIVQQLLDASFFSYQGEYLEKNLARLLYGAVLTNSVTRLELFTKCAFSHYMEYGLKLAERETCTFENIDMGNMFHAILQNYCILLEKNYDWDAVTEDQQEVLLQEAMEEAILSMPNDALLSSERNAYVLERIHRIMKRTVWALTKQICQGDFLPSDYEMEFVQTTELTKENLMRNFGRIDRVDTYEKENKVYVKIVDYKSGKTKFQLLQMYYGMQLQLVMYLDAAMKELKQRHPGKEIVPAGIFYYNLDDPLIEKPDLDENALAQEILKSLKMNGLVNNDSEVYQHMDHALITSTTSDFIPITLTKSGALSKKGTSAASTEDFVSMKTYAIQKVAKIADQIVSGDIRILPYQLGDQKGCDYCSYRSVCCFDHKIEGYQFDRKHRLNDDVVWDEIRNREQEA